MNNRNTLTGISLAIIATLIWSGNFIVARGIVKTIPPISLAFYRWVLATIILLPFIGNFFKIGWPQVKERFLFFLVAAATGVSLFNTLVYIGGHYSEAINLALIGTTSSPIMSVILAVVFLKERISWIRIIGMLICVVGVLFLLIKGDINNLFQLSFSTGDWWVLAAAFSFAIYNTMVKKKPASMPSTHFLFALFILGTVLLLPFYIYEYITVGSFKPSLANVSILLYLGIGASVVCFLLWNIAIAKLGSGRAALFGNLIPIFSSIEAVLILGEKVSWIQVTSFVIVIIGLVIANLQKRN